MFLARLSWMALLSAILALLTIGSCAKQDVRFFVVDGAYVTNSLEKAQAETPFKITVPGYVPGKGANGPNFKGALMERQKDEKARVEISYQYSGKPLIIIEETNRVSGIPFLPGDPSIEQFSVGKAEIPVYINHSPDLQFGPGYEYWWSSAGVHFSGQTTGFSKDDVLKMIASMING